MEKYYLFLFCLKKRNLDLFSIVAAESVRRHFREMKIALTSLCTGFGDVDSEFVLDSDSSRYSFAVSFFVEYSLMFGMVDKDSVLSTLFAFLG